MEQLILHLFGDYVTQSDWMAQHKMHLHRAAVAHAAVYSLPFLLLGPSPLAFAVILGSHFAIDRWRLARYVVWAKNFLAPSVVYDACRAEWVPTTYPWRECDTTGYHRDRPAWLAVWLMIAADNTLHLGINHLALRFL